MKNQRFKLASLFSHHEIVLVFFSKPFHLKRQSLLLAHKLCISSKRLEKNSVLNYHICFMVFTFSSLLLFYELIDCSKSNDLNSHTNISLPLHPECIIIICIERLKVSGSIDIVIYNALGNEGDFRNSKLFKGGFVLSFFQCRLQYIYRQSILFLTLGEVVGKLRWIS